MKLNAGFSYFYFVYILYIYCILILYLPSRTFFTQSAFYTQSANSVCVLHSVCILHPVCSLQSAFYTDRSDKIKNESQKLFVMDNFQIRFVLTVTILLSVRVQCPLASLLLRKQLQKNRLPFLVNCFSNLISSRGWQLDEIQFRSALALASSNSCGIQSLHCFLFLGLMMNYHWKLQCMYLVFIFRRILSGNVIVRVTGWPGSKCRRRQIRLRHICF